MQFIDFLANMFITLHCIISAQLLRSSGGEFQDGFRNLRDRRSFRFYKHYKNTEED